MLCPWKHKGAADMSADVFGWPVLSALALAPGLENVASLD